MFVVWQFVNDIPPGFIYTYLLSDNNNYKTLPSPFQNKSVAPPYVRRNNNWCEDTFLVPTLMTILMTHEILILQYLAVEFQF